MKKWSFFTNKLDEMQQQKKLVIESRGFWLAWTALAIDLMIQGANGADFRQINGEWIIFMLLCAYSMVEYTRNGIWTSYNTKPTMLDNLGWSLLAGVILTLFVLYRNSHQDWWRPEYWTGPVVAGMSGTVLTWIALQINAYFYYRRRRHLDEEPDEVPQQTKEET